MRRVTAKWLVTVRIVLNYDLGNILRSEVACDFIMSS